MCAGTESSWESRRRGGCEGARVEECECASVQRQLGAGATGVNSRVVIRRYEAVAPAAAQTTSLAPRTAAGGLAATGGGWVGAQARQRSRGRSLTRSGMPCLPCRPRRKSQPPQKALGSTVRNGKHWPWHAHSSPVALDSGVACPRSARASHSIAGDWRSVGTMESTSFPQTSRGGVWNISFGAHAPVACTNKLCARATRFETRPAGECGRGCSALDVVTPLAQRCSTEAHTQQPSPANPRPQQ